MIGGEALDVGAFASPGGSTIGADPTATGIAMGTPEDAADDDVDAIGPEEGTSGIAPVKPGAFLS